MSDELGRKCVAELVQDVGTTVYPVGRLDRDSEGLLLLTNDGELMNEILKARNYHEKEHEVKVNRPVTNTFLKKMSSGVPILDTVTRPCQVERTGEKSFRIVLTQGLNRQIRRMCDLLGFKVVRLRRIAIGEITLGDLPRGKWRYLTNEEIAYLKNATKSESER